MNSPSLIVVQVADLPWAFNPFRCAHKERFDRLVGRQPPPKERRSEIFAEMVSRLSEANLQLCPYHRVDWAVAAEAAIAAKELHIDPRGSRFAEFVRERGADWRAAESFFGEPIWLHRDGGLGNGQHRICALKCSRATRCLIER